MSWFDTLDEKFLDKAIKWTVIAIIAAVVVSGIYVGYKQWPRKQISAMAQKEIDKALSAVNKDPKDADARVKLANLYVEQEMWSDAQSQLETALSANKNHIAALALMGTVYEHNGQISKAIDYYKKSISLSDQAEFKSLNPYMYESIYRLGSIYIDQKKYKDAISVLEKGVKINQIDSDLRYKLGVAYFSVGRTDDAITQLEEALKYVPDFAEAYYWLGQAYAKKGEKDLAKQAYENAIKFKSDYKEAKEALSKLK
jgi:tetratricopeptide (TPR) repeat protein